MPDEGRAAEPVVVYSNRSRDYDFGEWHPLTPRRFGPSIDLMRAIGASRFMAPEPAPDAALQRLHTPAYLATVRAFDTGPGRPATMGIGPGDCPPFPSMHEASARVAGGSLAAVAAILAGETAHAFHPGGGLHHAMPARASGFCIYNDVALAAAAARDAGHRVLFVDLDVHHGDGTQAMFWDDPNVLTLSIHETGETLFPGTGYASERGGRGAEGSAVNVPLQPYSGDASWWPVVARTVPALAEAFRPTFLVTQHGCDSHALDPLAHLRLTTDSYARATRLLDEIAHRWCDGRWLATGGGGYDVYRVVPRSWVLVWLAQAHRDTPGSTPQGWRERWAGESEQWDQAPPPERFVDPPGLVSADPPHVVEQNRRTAETSLAASLERLGREPGAGSLMAENDATGGAR